MDPLIGALVAATVAWLSILVAVILPAGRLPTGPVKILGGLSILLLGLMVLGVAVPSMVPLAFLGGGILGVWLTTPPASVRPPRPTKSHSEAGVNTTQTDRWLRHAAPDPDEEEQEEETPQTPWL